MKAASKFAATLAALAVCCLAPMGAFANISEAADKPNLSGITCNGLHPIDFIDRTATYDSTLKDMRAIGPASIRCKFDGGDFDPGTFTYLYAGVEGTEYGPSAAAPRYAGKYLVTVTVQNDYYYDNATAYLTIHRKSLLSSDFELTVPSRAYTGEYQTPTVNQAGSSRPKFIEGDIEYSYRNNRDVGTATVVITGGANGNYDAGPVQRTFTITKKPITINAALCEVGNKPYDGNLDAPVLKVGFSGLADGVALALGSDYTVASSQFSSPDVAATGTVATVTVKLEPDGPRSKNYTLSASSFKATGYIYRATPVAGQFNYDIPESHTAGYATGVPAPTVKAGVPGMTGGGIGSRTVIYYDSTRAGSATVPQAAGEYEVYLRVAEGKNYYAAEFRLGTYTIHAALKPIIAALEPMDASVRLGGAAVPLTVAAESPNGGALSYQWYNGANNAAISGATHSSYTPNIEVEGVYRYYVVVTNTKVIAGAAQTDTALSGIVTYTVFGPPATSIEGAAVAIGGSYIYTGLAIDPGADSVKVTLSGKPLVYRVDYTYTMRNNINAGTATLTVSGRDLYKGSVEKTFAIAKKAIVPESDLVIQRSVVFNGGPQHMPVAFKSGLTGHGTISLTYSGLPSGFVYADVGTYSAKMNVGDGDNFKGLANYNLGTYDIVQKAPEASDFIYAIPQNHVYTGFPFGMGIGTVTAKGGGAGNLTVYYNGVLATPVNAGTYVVTVNVAGGKNYKPAADDNRVYIGDYTIHPEGWTAAQERGRAVPAPGGGAEGAVLAPFTALSPEFTAGPNPAARPLGRVDFFRSGAKIGDAALVAYDASGRAVKKINISDNSAPASAGRRVVGSWDLTGTDGRIVPAGVYLIRGATVNSAGQKERIAALVAVR
ncbi:MAG: MBG domain-containing protein [Chitinispirillales bacterium]|jgi:hypothetical protein|nr:MBG domain-containing protein [Chitinispirillales bacterium]